MRAIVRQYPADWLYSTIMVKVTVDGAMYKLSYIDQNGNVLLNTHHDTIDEIETICRFIFGIKEWEYGK